MNVQVTRCPHCQTSFRIRTPQLEVANGLVRCGSCLQVFNARQHVLTNSSIETTPLAAPAAMSNIIHLPSAKVDVLNSVVDDTLIVAEDMTTETVIDAAPVKTDASTEEANVEPAAAVMEEITEAVEESSEAEALVQESFDIVFAAPQDDPELADDAAAPTEESIHAEPEMALSVETRELAPALEFKSDRIADLKAEPLPIQAPSKRRPFAWGWLCASLLLLLLAAVQSLYFNMDTLSRTPQWRPTFVTLCSLINCQIPQIQDVNMMSTQHFTVNRHPQLQGALLVDVLLFNKAHHEQPFPDVQLNFQDLNERVVATRRFPPSHYLSGELAGANNMPVRTPVHIAFELLDPGVEAVSYEVQLLSNQ